MKPVIPLSRWMARRAVIDRRNLDARIQEEIREAKRIQRQAGCSWSEALRIAARKP